MLDRDLSLGRSQISMPAAFLFNIAVFLTPPLFLGDQLTSTPAVLSHNGSVQSAAAL